MMPVGKFRRTPVRLVASTLSKNPLGTGNTHSLVVANGLQPSTSCSVTRSWSPASRSPVSSSPASPAAGTSAPGAASATTPVSVPAPAPSGAPVSPAEPHAAATEATMRSGSRARSFQVSRI